MSENKFQFYNDISPEVLELSIAVLGLESSRIENPLHKTGIKSIGDLLSFYDHLKDVNGLGEIGVEIIKKATASFLERITKLDSASLKKFLVDNKNLEPFPRNQPVVDKLRQILNIDTSQKPINVLHIILPLVKSIAEIYGDYRIFEFINHYHGLDGQDTYTLQEIGDAEGLTRERVRQINEKTVAQLNTVLLNGRSLKGYNIDYDIVQEAQALLSDIKNKGTLINEQEICNLIEKRYGIELGINSRRHLKLLLIVYGFKELPNQPPSYNGSKVEAWQTDGTLNTPKLYNALATVYRTLVASHKALSIFELKIQVNKKKKIQLDETYILAAIKICPDIEIVNDTKYQAKFYCLPSAADQAYRVLAEAGKPMHFRDITKEINYRLAISNFPPSAYYRTVIGQMVSDQRFQAIGKSGTWKLLEWEHIHSQIAVEIMKDFFHTNNAPATIDEIYSYVIVKRPDVPKKSIIAYLYEKDDFIRVSKLKYALREWGHKPAESNTRFGSMLDRLHEAVKIIFMESKQQPIKRRDLVYKLESHTKINAANIYPRLKNLENIELEEDPEDKRQKIVKYKEASPDKKPYTIPLKNRQTIMQSVHQVAEQYLAQQPEQKALLSDLLNHVLKKLKCHKQTCYSYISRMENVKKEQIANKWYCYLIDEKRKDNVSVENFANISKVSDLQLQNDIYRSLKLLTLENVDVGLFQLGKIFEQELKKLLILAQEKKAFPVTKNDLNRLVDMIDCVVRAQIIRNKHHLTFLREERNERAHGKIPQQSEREEMMRQVQHVSGLYVDYIVTLHQEKEKLRAL